MADVPEDDDDDPEREWWFAPPTEGVVPHLPPPAVTREPRTIPHPIVGDMAAAFAEGKRKGREDGRKEVMDALMAEFIEKFNDEYGAKALVTRIAGRLKPI